MLSSKGGALPSCHSASHFLAFFALKCCGALGIVLTPRSWLWLSSWGKHPESIARPRWSGRQQYLLTLCGLHSCVHYSFFSLSSQQDSSIVWVPDLGYAGSAWGQRGYSHRQAAVTACDGSCRTWLGSVAFLRICCSVFSTPQRLSSVPMNRKTTL